MVQQNNLGTQRVNFTFEIPRPTMYRRNKIQVCFLRTICDGTTLETQFSIFSKLDQAKP